MVDEKEHMEVPTYHYGLYYSWEVAWGVVLITEAGIISQVVQAILVAVASEVSEVEASEAVEPVGAGKPQKY